MAYHITITNKESGDVLADRDTDTFFAVITDAENTQCTSAINAPTMLTAKHLFAVRGLFNSILDDHPELKALILYFERMKDKEKVAEVEQECKN